MAVDERFRRELQAKLEQVLGGKQAVTLMQLLPAEEPATKSDLADVRSELKIEIRESRDQLVEMFDLKFEGLEHRLLAAFRAELNAQTRAFFFATVGSMVTVAGLAIAAARVV